MLNKNGTYTKSKFSSTIIVQSVDNRVRYSQGPQELGKRTKLPLDITVFVIAIKKRKCLIENLIYNQIVILIQIDNLKDNNNHKKEFDPNLRVKLTQAELQLAAFQKQFNQQVNLFGGQSADQVMRELEELRRKKQQFEDLSRQMNGRNVKIQVKDKLRRLRNEITRLQEQNNHLESQIMSLQSQNQSLIQEISHLI